MAKDYDSIIEYENEHSGLDFKSVQYDKPKHAELLKDVIAMANADIDGERIIIIGVKHEPHGQRKIVPIQDAEFVDAANYQQLIRENVEPELPISYEPYRYKGQLLGVLRLLHCEDQPYILKKDFGTLRRGDCFVRKGCHQARAGRGDLDRLYESRRKTMKFAGSIKIGFWDTEYSQEITVSPVAAAERPSQRAAETIRRILAEKKRLRERLRKNGLLTRELVQGLSDWSFGNVPYENRSIETLEKNLANVEETYREDDIYELLEVLAFRLNFELFNEGDEYLEDATAVVEIPKDDSFFVSDRIIEEPQGDYLLPRIPVAPALYLNYPTVERVGERIRISQHIGDIKHQMRAQVFDEDVRLTLFRVPDSGEVSLTFRLFGRNLPVPIERKLRIRVKEEVTEPDAPAD